ncbi:hypothetical protein FRC01_005712 [Tulasnella sp. 417]|nr:hypothetical protein FRC01_005712 [Tulasnella sp. 417]
MFGLCSRCLSKALEDAPKGTHKGDRKNDAELLSPEFARALATGKPDVIKKFVVKQEQYKANSEKVLAGGRKIQDLLKRARSPVGKQVPSTNMPTNRNSLPEASSNKTPPPLQVTTLLTAAHSANPRPIPPTVNTASDSTLTSPPSTKVATADPPLPPTSLTEPSQELGLQSSVPRVSPELPSQNALRPGVACSLEIAPNQDHDPSDATSVTLRSESRDPTPEIEEVPVTQNANSTSSAVRAFLSSFQPPLTQYAPTFENLGVKNPDELLILKGLSLASIREFLQEVRNQTDMTFLQGLSFIGRLEEYSP